MFETPQSEHKWLDSLVGRWTAEGECFMGPDQEPQKNSGRLTCRSLGGLWLIGEGEVDDPESGPMTSILTLGFDPRRQCFVGTFVASMMTYLWPYTGVLDASGKKLPLDSEGPKFDGSGTTKYRDTIEIVDQDHWIFSGEILLDDGTWHTIMTTHHRRA